MEMGVSLTVLVDGTCRDFESPVDLLTQSLGCEKDALEQTIASMLPFKVQISSLEEEINSLTVVRDS